MKKLILAALAALGITGCSSTSQLSPTAQTDITDAYQVICGPSAPMTIAGLVGVANASFSLLPATEQSVVTTALSLCAAGVPTNEVVAGVDIFNMLLEVEQLVPAKKSAHIHALLKRHGKV
jgi:hypothetical protein